MKKLQDLSKMCRWTQVCRWMQVHVQVHVHKCRCIQLCKLQTQYIFTVYCVVHKIPFWLDPNNNNISIPKTAHFVNSRSKISQLYMIFISSSQVKRMVDFVELLWTSRNIRTLLILQIQFGI